MLRRTEHLLGRPALDDAPVVQHEALLAQAVDEREVVRDQHVREPVRLAQPRDQVEHAGLHRHVERARGLVEHEQARLDRQRAGDHDALTLAARELVRVAVRELRLEVDLGQQPGDALALLRARHDPVRAQRLDDACRTRMRGSSAASPSWKTICTARR